MTTPFKPAPNAALLLADGTVFFGYGIGALGTTSGEICFNTAMTGYQEILTDPSYAGQIITFTFPHIGNVGANGEDVEDSRPSPVARREQAHAGAVGLILREAITEPSNFRATQHLNDWLKARGISGISGIDTRALTRHIRTHGAQNCAIVVASRQSPVASEELLKKAKAALAQAPDMNGLELAAHVTTHENYGWNEKRWGLGKAYAELAHDSRLTTYDSLPHVVAIDYGVKSNILRSLASSGVRLTVVGATTTAEDILALKPDGVFLSNGPGDPAATGSYAVPVINKIIAAGVPIFGICLGHQMLGIALGCQTLKMKQGHRGANHPVKDLQTGKVEITSQNHGFAISDVGLPADVEVTHRSLFDGTIQGIRHKTLPIFSVQGHPEASPGPHDSQYLFARFVAMMTGEAKEAA
ncbi:MAG: glutamine-hydrolyzing carbamoyl-phosphate synthase small subunit [Rickettsiales bacterium]|nr:glutamine-hydrolyzing carbamoyl-phosphate synthase small subunit [Rickettsiales bacterium]